MKGVKFLLQPRECAIQGCAHEAGTVDLDLGVLQFVVRPLAWSVWTRWWMPCRYVCSAQNQKRASKMVGISESLLKQDGEEDANSVGASMQP